MEEKKYHPKTIKVSREVHEELTRIGKKGQTYNEIIENLLLLKKK